MRPLGFTHGRFLVQIVPHMVQVCQGGASWVCGRVHVLALFVVLLLRGGVQRRASASLSMVVPCVRRAYQASREGLTAVLPRPVEDDGTLRKTTKLVLPFGLSGVVSDPMGRCLALFLRF